MLIKNLLQKHNQNLKQTDILFENIFTIIKKETGIDIKKENINIKNNTLHIKTKPIYKEKINLLKPKILEDLKKYNIFEIT